MHTSNRDIQSVSAATCQQPATHLIYLHGFRSSPQSVKARKVAARIAGMHPSVHLWCPQLPPSPRAAMELIAQGTADWPAAGMAVIGSSLGGFYASALAAMRNCRAALINPAVDPARDLARYIGEQTQWHRPEESFFFQPEFIGELARIRQDTLEREREAARLGHGRPPTYVLIAKGDEVLDWREMAARFPDARQRLIEGGDHAVSDFDLYIDELLAFLRLA